MTFDLDWRWTLNTIIVNIQQMVVDIFIDLSFIGKTSFEIFSMESINFRPLFKSEQRVKYIYPVFSLFQRHERNGMLWSIYKSFSNIFIRFRKIESEWSPKNNMSATWSSLFWRFQCTFMICIRKIEAEIYAHRFFASLN